MSDDIKKAVVVRVTVGVCDQEICVPVLLDVNDGTSVAGLYRRAVYQLNNQGVPVGSIHSLVSIDFVYDPDSVIDIVPPETQDPTKYWI